MTTITPVRPRAGSTVDGRVTLLRVVAAELVKLRSVRSVVWAAVAAVLSLMIPGVFAAVGIVVTGTSDDPGADPLGGTFNGITFATWVMAAVGVLAATGEYSGGTIRVTLAAVPDRVRLVLGKAVAVATVVFALAVTSVFATFLISRQVLAGSDFAISLTAPGVARALVGAALQMAAVALLGLGFGLLLRSTAGAITLLVGVLTLPSLFALLLPDSVAETVVPLLPDRAVTAVLNLTQNESLAPWTGFAVFAGYVAVTLLGATLLFRHRDA